ncbi:MAG: glycosyltransferase family 2 protein [bacterium]
MEGTKISCIIPAFNEGPRIDGVLAAAHKHPLLNEIIVVDDCSADGTKDVVKKFDGIRLIVHEKNYGKSKAIVTGIKEASGDFLLFLDADLVGLTAKNISDLIEPVISGQADISISLRGNTPWQYKKIGLDFISGERVFPKKLVEAHLDKIENLRRFGLESFLNKLIIKNRCRIKVVRWDNVESPWKSKKDGFWPGVKGDIKMTMDVLRTNHVWGYFYQIIKMLQLKV